MALLQHRLQQLEQTLNASQAEVATLRTSEAHYRELFVNANGAIVLFRLDGTITEVNQQVTLLLGWSQAELVGQHYGRFTSEVNARIGAETIQHFLDTGDLSEQYEADLLNRFGQLVPVEVCIRPLYDGTGKPTGCQGIYRDIRKRKETERALEKLSREVLVSQEEERRRIAYELHDQIGQALTVLKLNLEALQNSPKRQTSRLSDSLQIVETTLAQVRSLSLDLRPPLLDDLGLVAALRWHSQEMAQRVGWHLILDLAELPRQPDNLISIATFRVAQEALTNVVRHAHARQVTVALQGRSKLTLRIADDGCGFALDAAHSQAGTLFCLGLLSMSERVRLAGGHFEIESHPGKGTTIMAHFPLSEGEEDRCNQIDLVKS